MKPSASLASSAEGAALKRPAVGTALTALLLLAGCGGSDSQEVGTQQGADGQQEDATSENGLAADQTVGGRKFHFELDAQPISGPSAGHVVIDVGLRVWLLDAPAGDQVEITVWQRTDPDLDRTGEVTRHLNMQVGAGPDHAGWQPIPTAFSCNTHPETIETGFGYGGEESKVIKMQGVQGSVARAVDNACRMGPPAVELAESAVAPPVRGLALTD